ncbi:MAG: lysylphosphatidylglycerol synthase domain-containing protein [Burkholderiales bacterium]
MSRERFLKLAKNAWLVLFVLASLFFVFDYFQQQSARLVGPLRISIPYLILAVVLQAAMWTNAAWCWGKIIWLTAGVRLPLLVGVSHLALTTLGKYFPGKVWGMAARAALMKQQGVLIEQSLLATFHEQLIFLHAAVVLSCLMIALLFKTEWAWAVGALGLLSVPVGMLGQKYLVRLSRHLASRFSVEKQPTSWRDITHKNYLVLLLAYLAVWLWSGLSFACIYQAFFETHTGAELIFALLLANAAGNTLGFLALFAPGGIGVREVVASAILAGFIPLNDAIMLNLLYRLCVVAFELLGSLTLLLPGSRSFKA